MCWHPGCSHYRGKAKTDDVINVDDNSDDISAFSTTKKEDLIALVRKAKISSLSKGSVPNMKGSCSNVFDSEGSHSSSNSSSRSSSSSSEGKSEVKNETGSG